MTRSNVWAALFGLALLMTPGCGESPSACEIGSAGCACTADLTCAAGLTCDANVCTAANCVEGTAGCPCADGDVCEGVLTCNEVGYCADRRGRPGEDCFSNRTCLSGAICGAGNLCVACDAGTAGCDCFANGTCENALLCEMNRCTSGTNAVVPEDPQCYSPCNTGFTDASGTYRACSVEGLMDGCMERFSCVEGSCVPEGDGARVCAEDSECPDHQVCIAGQCYSNCEYDSDCGGMARCFRQACRVPCAANAAASCPEQTHCQLTDGDFGYCMPTVAPMGAPSEGVDGTFSLSLTALSFTNVDPIETITVTNEGPRPVDFTIRKLEHQEFRPTGPVLVTTNPMPWLGLGAVGAVQNVNQYQFRVAGNGGTFTVELRNAASGVPNRWDGAVEVSSEYGDQRVDLQYSSTPNGRWAGTAYYFAQFGDTGLDTWIANRTSTAALGGVKNALIQRWGDLRRGAISLDQFNAIITATTTESWRWPSVEDACADEACYLYTTGILTYTNANDQPVPTGVVELPMAMDLFAETNGSLRGRIVSEESLHYAGDPAVTLTFSNPGACAAGVTTACVSLVQDFSSRVVIGGRSVTTPNDACGGDPLVQVRRATPWILPGFLGDTYVDTAPPNARYRHECRGTSTPFAAVDANRSASLSGANPVPDGQPRVRDLQIVDGMLINQEALYILFKETFQQNFLGGAADSFSAYGMMVLNRANVELEPSDYVGNTQAAPPQPLVDLAAASACDSDTVADLNITVSAANAQNLANVLLYGRPAGPQPTAYSNSTIHYLCGSTGRFDGGLAQGGHRDSCPAGSNVRFFHYPGAFPTDLPCQFEGQCGITLNEWINNPASGVLVDPLWACTNVNAVYCDDNRSDLRTGKTFYLPAGPTGAQFLPLQAEIDYAFRYRTQFQNRQGGSLGFAPEICQDGGDAIPYCYDPEAIEQVRDRVSCLAHLFQTYPAALTAINTELRTYLTANFSSNGGGLVPVRDGFEALYAELLIMLGDEAYTNAFQSRFDLAASSRAAFEGSLFEPNGIDISGVAGYEMFTLYQAAQYYQLALDRFYSLTPYIRANLAGGVGNRFVTQQTVTDYFDRVLRASTQSARVWSEVAKRYQRLNRADLARFAVQRAYTSAYLESVIVARLMQDIAATAPEQTRDQIYAIIDRQAVSYRIALLDMREVHGDLTDEVNYFGFPPDYIPLPALDGSSGNAFEVLLGRAQQSSATAAQREDVAIGNNRSFETDAVAFQSELVRIRNTYENQLADVCGTFVGDDGNVYPAIPKYASLSSEYRYIADPCGRTGNGALHDAIGSLELMQVEARSLVVEQSNLREQIDIELDRISAQCDPTGGILYTQANVNIQTALGMESLQDRIDAAQFTIGEIQQGLQTTTEVFKLLSCNLPTAVGGGNCTTAIPMGAAITVTAAVATAARHVQRGIVEQAEDKLRAMERAQITVAANQQCELLQSNGDFRVREIMLGFAGLELNALKAQYQMQLAFANITRLRNQATRIMAEQTETEQLSINLEAARNDPNTRIYRNDAVLNADVSFYDALRDAYRATVVFEYYTSQSYARKEELSLVRLVSRGDYNLENYLDTLQDSYFEFLETAGRPDSRVDIFSLRDDVLAIPRYGEDGNTLSDAARVELFRVALTDTRMLNPQGHVAIPFATDFSRLSPLTRNHKIAYIEAEFIGSDVGDALGRVYVTQAGTGTVSRLAGGNNFYRLPERSAVVNPFFNGVRAFTPEVYRNERLRDRPYVNSNWVISVNQRDEFVNQDINLNALTDVRIYVYYTDFTEL